MDHDRDNILPGPSSPSSSHSLPHPHTGDDSELAAQSQDADVADSTSTQMTRAVSICKVLNRNCVKIEVLNCIILYVKA